VVLSRRHVADGHARAIVTVSKNANVATGPQGDADSASIAAGVAAALGISPDEVLVSSTGVIGRALPMDRIGAHLEALRGDPGAFDLGGFDQVAVAMMTTDTVPKTASAAVGDATIVGVAKGVGMIEPDMATLLTYFVTDAAISADHLRAIFGRVVATTFNCLSIDTDTSTSDTALVLANGLAGPVDLDDFEAALHAVALDLVKQIARDGEGATKLIEVTVDHAADAVQAKRVAKLVVNSPLVKTAVHGSDPNWGRVAMAVGKASEYPDIEPGRTTIRFGSVEVFPRSLDDGDLAALESLMDADEITIGVSLGLGDATATVWGCDLSDGYVRINADYTT
jgi:glutamate N-acetyltransferase/amino-acid N-acetyltransferase